MKLSKRKIERIIRLSEACFQYLLSYEPHNGLLMSPSFGIENTEIGSIMDKMMDGLREIAPCREYQKLTAYLLSLSDRELRELLALIFIGRGPWNPSEFQSAFDHAQVGEDRHNEIGLIAANLFASDDLAEGFEKLNRARII